MIGRSYSDLSINEKISLKGIFQSFLNISTERFRESITAKDAIASGSLLRSLATFLSGNETELRATISFDLSGRFIDMGVGRGYYKGKRKKIRGKYYEKTESGKKGALLTRQPIVWYSKVKYREVARLREILVKDYGIYLMHLGEELIQNIKITY